MKKHTTKKIRKEVEKILIRALASQELVCEDNNWKKEIADKFLKSDFKELNAKINRVRLPNPDIGYMTIRSSLEVLLDMAVYQSQLSKHTTPPSKEEFLKICTDRLSFSYDELLRHYQNTPRNL